MSLRFGLIGVFLAPEHVGYCFYHDADVEQESPVLNIPQVSSYPAFHLGKFFGFSPVAGDLRPSGNSGFDKVAHHVFVNQLGIFLCMFQHMGSGTYNGHLSFEYINELRQFVQIAFTQEVAELGLAGIILGSLQLIGQCVHFHGTELIAFKDFPVFPVSLLFEEYGTR